MGVDWWDVVVVMGGTPVFCIEKMVLDVRFLDEQE